MSPGEIHFWLIERDYSTDLALPGSWLSASERDRADRYKSPDRRDNFIYHRAMLRQILAEYAGLMPAEVPLTTSPAGKPLWNDDTTEARQLNFNLSHSGELAILGVTQGRTIGVDVECGDLKTDYDAVARQMFSAREMAIYENLLPGERADAALRAWTRKEAYLKAVGIGLNQPVAEIVVTFCVEQAPQLLALQDSADHASNWLLHSWSPRPAYFAAAAVRRESDPPLIKHYTMSSFQGSECVTTQSREAQASTSLHAS